MEGPLTASQMIAVLWEAARRVASSVDVAKQVYMLKEAVNHSSCRGGPCGCLRNVLTFFPGLFQWLGSELLGMFFGSLGYS